ncbi:MAG: hypothetical protein QOI66_42, partial [Myxococcales bacterium]|nr:hypothetical protein [Myxococcales bacterium]
DLSYAGYSIAWFNRFHWTTEEEMIRREALFRPGQLYNQNLVDETARNLENPIYTSALGIIPVKSAQPGKVDVLIVTRDLWSLRLNTNFEFQQGKLLYLTASLAENNLFGWRKLLALVTDLDLGRLAVGPDYVDPNIHGTRLQATAAARLLFARDTHAVEGSTSRLTFGYPLYSLDSRWGAGIDYGHSDAVVRRFQGTVLRPVRFDFDPATKMSVDRPWAYRLKTFKGTSQVQRRFHVRGVVQTVSAGHFLSVTRPSLLPNFPPDPTDHPTVSEQFERTIFPLAGVVSELFARYSVSLPTYRIYRDLSTFDLRETVQLGPGASVLVERSDSLLGADPDPEHQYWNLSATGSWAFALLDGLQNVGLGWSGRYHDGRWTDQSFSASASAASPVFHRAFRIVAGIGTNILIDDTQNLYSYLGGDSGLRGYAVGDLVGKSSVLGHVEVRSMALSVLSLRAGGLVFYDFGDASTPPTGLGTNLDHAINTLLGFRLYHDVGFGLRVLIPQFNTYVLRVDWAFPLQNTDGDALMGHTKAGWPGRFSAGFAQVF